MKLVLFVGIGGFLGSTSRYGIYQLFLKLFPSFPTSGTLLVNILGSFLLGLMVHSVAKMDRSTYLLLSTGFCGGFTTFSTFSVENIKYLTQGNFLGSALYIGLSLVLSLLAAMGGWYFGKNLGLS